MNVLRILVAALAVWRLTHLLQREDGPFDVIKRSRHWLRRALLEGLADCFYCLSLWLAAPFAYFLAASWLDRAMLWPALSGAAIILNRFVDPPTETPLYYEDPFQEEKSQCSAAEIQEDIRPEKVKPIPARYEYTVLSCGPLCSGTQAERG